MVKKLEQIMQEIDGIDLTLKDVVETIANGCDVTSIRFVDNYVNNSRLLGLYLDDNGQREILINTEQTMDEKRLTILHEMTHAMYALRGYKQSETEVRLIAERKYHELYKKGDTK